MSKQTRFVYQTIKQARCCINIPLQNQGVMYNTQAVATNIRNARLFRNYSQDYLAYKLKISQNGYSKIELGYTRLSVERLIIIADVLEVELTRLLEITDIRADIKAISHIAVIPKILEIICHTTGMGFAAVARVTDEHWTACSVRDEIQFGLQPGDELKLETTICNEIRQSGNAVIIDEVAKDPVFSNHHTPALYGFKSYISMPIIRQDGAFFGTLCAIDPKPAKLNTPAVINMFKLFADLISVHLNSSGFYINQFWGSAKQSESKGVYGAVQAETQLTL